MNSPKQCVAVSSGSRNLFGIWRRFFEGEVIELDPSPDIEGSYILIPNELARGGNSDQTEGQSFEVRIRRPAVVALTDSGEEFIPTSGVDPGVAVDRERLRLGRDEDQHAIAVRRLLQTESAEMFFLRTPRIYSARSAFLPMRAQEYSMFWQISSSEQAQTFHAQQAITALGSLPLPGLLICSASSTLTKSHSVGERCDLAFCYLRASQRRARSRASLAFFHDVALRVVGFCRARRFDEENG